MADVVQYPDLYDLRPKVLGDSIFPIRLRFRVPESDPVEYYDLRGYKFWFTAKRRLAEDWEDALIQVYQEVSIAEPDPVYEVIIDASSIDTTGFAPKESSIVLEYDIQWQSPTGKVLTPLRGMILFDYQVTEVKDYPT